MKTRKVAVLAALLLLFVGWSNLSAQAFFPNRVKGTLEVKFLPPYQIAVEVHPAKPTVQYGRQSAPATDTLLHESGHVDPPKQQ